MLTWGWPPLTATSPSMYTSVFGPTKSVSTTRRRALAAPSVWVGSGAGVLLAAAAATGGVVRAPTESAVALGASVADAPVESPVGVGSAAADVVGALVVGTV